MLCLLQYEVNQFSNAKQASASPATVTMYCMRHVHLYKYNEYYAVHIDCSPMSLQRRSTLLCCFN